MNLAVARGLLERRGKFMHLVEIVQSIRTQSLEWFRTIAHLHFLVGIGTRECESNSLSGKIFVFAASME